MNYRRGIDTYRQTDMQTMGKEKIIVLLYEKMLEHFDAAAAASSLDRMESANEARTVPLMCSASMIGWVQC